MNSLSLLNSVKRLRKNFHWLNLHVGEGRETTIQSIPPDLLNRDAIAECPSPADDSVDGNYEEIIILVLLLWHNWTEWTDIRVIIIDSIREGELPSEGKVRNVSAINWIQMLDYRVTSIVRS